MFHTCFSNQEIKRAVGLLKVQTLNLRFSLHFWTRSRRSHVILDFAPIGLINRLRSNASLTPRASAWKWRCAPLISWSGSCPVRTLTEGDDPNGAAAAPACFRRSRPKARPSTTPSAAPRSRSAWLNAAPGAPVAAARRAAAGAAAWRV